LEQTNAKPCLTKKEVMKILENRKPIIAVLLAVIMVFGGIAAYAQTSGGNAAPNFAM